MIGSCACKGETYDRTEKQNDAGLVWKDSI